VCHVLNEGGPSKDCNFFTVVDNSVCMAVSLQWGESS